MDLLLQGSQLSWNCPEILLIWSECPDMDLCYAVATLFTGHDYVYVADVECLVMFSLVTLYCFMCNIALVTFLGLQYWSASMVNIYEHRKACIFCVLSLVKTTSVLKFSKNLVLKFHFLLLGALLLEMFISEVSSGGPRKTLSVECN